MRPGHVEPDEAERFVRSVDEELVLRAGLQRAEPGDRRQARRLQALPLIADRHVGIGRDALRKIDLDVGLSRTVGPGRVDGNLRHRHLVGDERVVGEDRGGKETLAGKAVRQEGCPAGRTDQRGRERKPRSGVEVCETNIGNVPKYVAQGSERATGGVDTPALQRLPIEVMTALKRLAGGARAPIAPVSRRAAAGV